MTPPQSPHLTLITGASRGLGHAIAAALVRPGQRLLTISRRATTLAPLAGFEHIDWTMDLAEPLPVAQRLSLWLAELPRPASVTLIHNAAMLSALVPLADSAPQELALAARVNLEAPLLLTAAFLKATAGWPGPRKVLFISSGLARRAMAGSASYCATKAGLDHLARAIALEEACRHDGARVASLAPGVIDTDMQVQLRAADPAAFAAHGNFVQLQQSGQLASPAQAAAQVLAYLARADFGAQPVGDVRDPG